MFLHKLMENNAELLDCAQYYFKMGRLLPDTYLIDLDAVLFNGKLLLKEAGKYDLRLYFMLKQLGRNPLIARELIKAGYPGAVAVDFREALGYLRHGIRLGNVGHLVQIPQNALRWILEASPEIVTVYSLEKAEEINAVCRELGTVQGIMLKVCEDGDMTYPGQAAGFQLEELEGLVRSLKRLQHIHIEGLCSFPCFLYDERIGRITATENMNTLSRAKALLAELGYTDLQINAPSACCTESIPLIHTLGATHTEPGHGLSGTTPYHAQHSAPETCAYVYLSEVSHTYKGRSCCYGGGSYPRGHLKHALVGYGLSEAQITGAEAVPSGNIDYHFELEGSFRVSDPVLMCFRTQMFTTRSSVAVISGLSHGQPRIEGIFDSHGNLREEGG